MGGGGGGGGKGLLHCVGSDSSIRIRITVNDESERTALGESVGNDGARDVNRIFHGGNRNLWDTRQNAAPFHALS